MEIMVIIYRIVELEGDVEVEGGGFFLFFFVLVLYAFGSIDCIHSKDSK